MIQFYNISRNAIVHFRVELLLIFIILITPHAANAGHVVGAEISYKWISGNTYEITLTLYRDCASPIPAPNNPVVNYSSVTCGKNNNVVLTPVSGTGIEITRTCGSQTTTCNGGTALGIQKYVYKTTITLSAQCSDWVFGYDVCCRNCDITTVATPGCSGAPGTYVSATLNNIVAPTNSSPVFTNLPMSLVCIGQPFQYNNGVVEINGDSLVYSFITPQERQGTNITYLPGYTAGSFLSSSTGITLNSTNGDITINATSSEISIMAILVKEYRNGILVGSVIRDVQVWTMVCTNRLPSATGINSTSNFNISVCAGAPLNIFINSMDENAGQIVTMTWNNGIPGASFTSSGSPYPTGQFNWTPTLADARPQPYTFSVTVQDDNCPLMGIRSYSYSITVASVAVIINSTNSPCASPPTGTANAVVTGSAPITYSWSPGGSTSSTISGLSAGAYTVTVTESHGCSATATGTVNAPSPLTATIAASSNVTCYNSNDGSIAISASGGIAPYIYNWSPSGGTNANASNLSAGTYTISVTDRNSCNQIIQTTISQPTALTTLINTSPALCNGESTGSATVTTTGGIGPYVYFWTPGGNMSNLLTGVSAGNYSVMVTDARGCTKNETVIVSEPQPLSLSVITTATTCSSSTGTAKVIATGGVTPYTYQWSTGSNTSAINALAAGGYSIVIVDANGCSSSDAAAVSNISGPTLALNSLTSLNCNRDNNGSATVSVLSGVNPLSYNWSPYGGNGLTANGLSAGTYTLTVTDANNCVSALSVDITEPTPLDLSITPVNPTCYGIDNGIISTKATGGTAPYSYSWSPGGSTSSSLLNAVAGNYQIVVTDSKSCTYSDVASLLQPALLTGSVTSTIPVSCSGGNNGTATIATSGGTSPYNFEWSPYGGNMETAAGLSAGNFSVIVTDANNCSTVIPVSITQPSPLSTTISNTLIQCNGAANSTANVLAIGGKKPYNYSWSPSVSNSSTASNLNPGNYSVIITDANGCSVSDSTIISEPTPITSTLVSVSNASCFGLNNGSGSVSTSGGVGPYTYLWSPSGGNSSTAIGLSAEVYTITMTDANQCTLSTVISINQPSAIIDSAYFTNITCNGLSNGSANVTTTGGSGPYTYLWNTGETTSSISQIPANNYTVTISDAKGCTATETFNITQPSALTITSASTPATCGNANGSVNAIVSGGTSPYNFFWSPGGMTSPSINNLTAGTYTLVITDSKQCSKTTTVGISNFNGPVLRTASAINVSCYGGNDGQASVNATGGVGPYIYLWSPLGGNAPTATNLMAGNYTVQVTDANQCITSIPVLISEPASISILANTSSPLCKGSTDGNAIANVTGGIAPYRYLWSTGARAQAVNNLSAGKYSVEVTDQNGCSLTDSISISEPSAITLSVTTTLANCNAQDGSANVIASGGSQSYTYQWSSGSTSASADFLGAGNYDVTVTDSNGCTSSISTLVNEKTGMILSTSAVDAVCFGASNGSASVQVTGGVMPYRYEWIPSVGNAPALNNLKAGNYIINTYDANGCIAFSSVSVGQPSPILTNITTQDSRCFGNNDGVAIVNVSGGISPYVYSWSNGKNNNSVDSLAPGNYTITATDANGCSVTTPVTINSPSALNMDPINTNPICIGQLTMLSANVSGGTAPYSYSWFNGPHTSQYIVSPVINTTYTLTIVDANGCTSNFSNIYVPVHDPLLFLQPLNVTICEGENATLNVQATGGNGGAYNYNWNNGMTGMSINVSPTHSTIYRVTATDNCTSLPASVEVQVLVNPKPVVQFMPSPIAGCTPVIVDFTDQSITGSSCTYKWNFGDGSQSTDKNGNHIYSQPGDYSVSHTVTDILGCSSTLEVANAVSVYPLPTASFEFSPEKPATNTTPIKFSDESINATQWLWDFGDGLGGSNAENPLHTYNDTGEYTIRLISITNKGCIDTAYRKIRLNGEFKIYIPNAFTPNSDDINDKFFPIANGMNDFDMYIYNRWGLMLYQTNDLNKPWNGKVNGIGTDCQNDVYIYKIYVRDYLDKTHEYIGKVTLVR